MVPKMLVWVLALLANVLFVLSTQEPPISSANSFRSAGPTSNTLLQMPHLASTPTAGNTSLRSPPPPLPPLSLDGDVCVAITGGAGQIAYALVPLILHGKVFGKGRKVRLRLLDIEPCAEALDGVAMEIQDCYSDLVTEVIATCDPEVAFKGADVAVLLGGFPRLQGMRRRDLVAKNVPIMADHGAALNKCAKKTVRVLVVANPACTNCLVASTSAPSIPRGQFSSLARLDQDRLSAMVAEEIFSKISPAVAGGNPVPPSRLEVRGAYLWGNHSPTMWPDVSRAEAKVDGRWVPVDSALRRRGGDFEDTRWREWVSTSLTPAVRDRGTRVIEARGKSSAMSAANSIANHLRDWLSSPAAAAAADPAGGGAAAAADDDADADADATADVTRRQYDERGSGDVAAAATAAAVAGGVSMGVFSDGNTYGIPDGLVCSFPVECGEGQHRILEGLCPDRDMLEASTQELLEEREEAYQVLRDSGLGPGC